MISNLTQHSATPEQLAQGVVNLEGGQPAALLTFSSVPRCWDVFARASALADLAHASGCAAAMIGGAPFLMASLERALELRGIIPAYAFSERVSSETAGADGVVTKVNTFVHSGWVAPTLTELDLTQLAREARYEAGRLHDGVLDESTLTSKQAATIRLLGFDPGTCEGLDAFSAAHS